MAYESLRAMGIFLLKMRTDTKCIHLRNEIANKGKLFAKKKNMTFKCFVEELINEKTKSRDCKVCKNSYCFSVGHKRTVKNCERFVK